MVEAVFRGLRPAVVGLLAAAALVLMNQENFGNYHTDKYQFIISVIIFLIAFIGTRKFKVSPILMIVLCGAAGYFLY
jgi:chromate transporter